MAIWDFRKIRKEFDGEHVTLDEGQTPVEELTVNGSRLFIKREDKNPTGSFKDRGVAFKVSMMKSNGIKNAVISSSGNAAISYLEYSKLYPELILDVIVSQDNVNARKLEKIKANLGKHNLIQSNQAKKERARIVSEKKAENLSTSLRDDVLKGYWGLGFELARLIKKEFKTQDYSNSYIFFPVSSGAALVGTVQGLTLELESQVLPRIIVCQTQAVCPIVRTLYPDVSAEESSLADSITDKSALRSPQILKIVNETNGDAIAITDEELHEAKSFAEQIEIEDLSYTSLLSVAGFLRFKSDGVIENAICIASGL
jgi:threonine synthase